MRIDRQRRGGISVAAMALALVAAQPALAQSNISTLQGHVDGVAAGTEVVATDRSTGQRVTAAVDANGDYRILGVRPSTYDVSVAGRGTQATTVLVGQTATLDFVTEAAAAGPEVVVTGSRTIQDVRTQSVSTNITPAQIENLPQNQRNFLNFADLAPGVAVSRGGNAQFSSAGTAAQNTNVLLDGLSLKNPINHGGVFGQNFGLGNPFPQSAIQEYKVDTQNFGAETGQVGAALITAVTKTGGNSVHGSGFIEFQPGSFIEQPYFDKLAGVPKPRYDRKQFGGELSGPIIKDKLVLYVAGEGLSAALPATTAMITGNAAVPASVSSAVLVSRNTDFHQGLYFGKLTFFATGNDTINAEAFIRRENNLTDIDPNAALSHGRTILTHEDRYQLNWQHRAGDFLNNLNFAYDRSEQSTPSVGTGPEYLLASDATTNNVLAQLGANSFNQGDVSKSYTFKDDAILSKGAHTLKAGAQVVLLDLSRTVNDHFNGTYFFANPGAGASFDPTTATPTNYRINTAPTPTVAFKDTQLGFYVQDEWQPNDHLTVNAGLRYDLETNANNNNYVTPAKIVTALQNYQGWKAVGINPADYISTGSNRKPEYGAIQPRLGVSYDVGGDHDFVVFAGAGRYFDRSLFIEGVIETLTNSNNVVTGAFCQTAGQTGCLPFTSALRDPNNLRAAVAANGTGGSVFLLNNKTTLPFSDQFDVGVRKRFGAIRAELTYSHIRSHNIFQFVRANYFSNGFYTRILQKDAAGNVIGCTNGGNAAIQDNISSTNYAACPAMNGQLPGFNGKLDIGASEGTANYNAIYLKLEKPFTDLARWGFTSALTLQFARSNDAQELNNDEFFNGTRQDVYGTNYVNGVEKYRLVTTGYYRAPFGITVSGNLTLTSGPSFGNVIFGGPADNSIYGNFGGVFYPKPFIGYKRLDLRLAKTFKMPWDHGHELTLDIQAFNVFNWLNRNYTSWGAGSGATPTLTENSQIANDARSFQAGVKYRF